MDRLGVAERGDAWVDGVLYVQTDAGVTELRLEQGALSLPTAPAAPDEGLLPAWADVPKRPGARGLAELPAGTPVSWADAKEGGVWVRLG